MQVGGGRAAVCLEFDDAGDLVRTSAEDRPYAEGRSAVPRPWGGVMRDYQVLDGVRIPTRAEVAGRSPPASSPTGAAPSRRSSRCERARARPLLAAARRGWSLGAAQRPGVRGRRGADRPAPAPRSLPLRTRGTSGRGVVRDRDGADPRRPWRLARGRRGGGGRNALGGSVCGCSATRCAAGASGVIPDIDEAVGSPRRLTDDAGVARQVLDLAATVPTPVWGRDEQRAGEMWNSNSVTAWLIARCGLDVAVIAPPPGGRAPGWHAGVVVAARGQPGRAQATAGASPS